MLTLFVATEQGLLIARHALDWTVDNVGNIYFLAMAVIAVAGLALGLVAVVAAIV